MDYVSKHAGEQITLYVREYGEMWPKKNEWTKPQTHYTVKFTPTGDATNEKTKLPGWLKSQKPEIKKGSHFSLDGAVCYDSGDCLDGVQVDSKERKLMSLNFMNQEVFVRV